jgi:hypothetical protein
MTKMSAKGPCGSARAFMKGFTPEEEEKMQKLLDDFVSCKKKKKEASEQ